jgi:uncharacterized protein with von Willebrand factor type A (vWA) domain
MASRRTVRCASSCAAVIAVRAVWTPGRARQQATPRTAVLDHNLDGTFADRSKLLDEAVLAERKQLARDLDDDARLSELRARQPAGLAGQAVRELADYRWRSAEAREKYQQIKDLLGREMLDQRFAG